MNYSKITYVLAVVIAGIATWAVSPQGAAILAAHPKISAIVAAIAAIGALVKNPAPPQPGAK